VWRARTLRRPLLVLEAIRVGSRWASRRVHRFVLQGMADNARRFDEHGVAYHPYVEEEAGQGTGLLEALATDAAVVVTDLFPAHFHPRMLRAAIDRLDVRVETVDGLGAVPLALPNRDFTVAHSFRRWVQKALPGCWDPPVADPLVRGLGGARVHEDVRRRWPAFEGGKPTGGEALPLVLAHTPHEVLDHGGELRARLVWKRFVTERLDRYHRDRSHPDDDVQSSLSPWLHFGQIGVHELLADLLGDWDPSAPPPATGKRLGWWGRSDPVEAFLDELITWRELGTVQAHRNLRAFTSFSGLPPWALKTLGEHRDDPRSEQYSLDELERAVTSDPLWNAAQRQLVSEGRIHNALRMLWGKKVLGWTAEPEEAFEILVELNNRYALDGRDPNSWSGIGWVFGRFDRAWGPERPVYGKVRYMTSASSRKKWRLDGYLQRFGTSCS
jgi:deoxyribodipyrimidine photo-lyase